MMSPLGGGIPKYSLTTAPYHTLPASGWMQYPTSYVIQAPMTAVSVVPASFLTVPINVAMFNYNISENKYFETKTFLRTHLFECIYLYSI